jgi:predicted ester cyclase
MSSANSQIIRRWFEEVWNQGNAAAIDEMSHPHTRGYGQAEQGRTIDMDEFKELWRNLRAAFPDIQFTIEDTIEQGDKVAARWSAIMTHTGNFLGIAPTQRQAKITGISYQRMDGGKIVEGWDNWDQLGLLVQIGATKLPNLVTGQA